MGKKKKQASTSHSGSWGQPTIPKKACETPLCIQSALGDPITVSQLAEGFVPLISRILLSAETMHAAALESGDLVGIAISHEPPRPLPKATLPNFAPAQGSEDLQEAVPLPISSFWDIPGTNNLADYVLVGEAWSCVKLQKGTAQLSGPLHRNLGSPPIGSTILFYRLDIDRGLSAKHVELELVTKASEGNKSPCPVVGIKTCLPSKSVQSRDSGSTDKGFEKQLHERQLEWVKQALQGVDSRKQSVLNEITLRQLSSRWLLPNCLVPITVLGCSVLFRVRQIVLPEGSSEGCYVQVVGGCSTVAACASHPKKDTTSENESNVVLLEWVRNAVVDSVKGSSRDVGVEAAVRAAKNGIMSLHRVKQERIGGIKAFEKSLQSLVVLPLKNPDIFLKYGLKPPKGIIFHGPPGTGKTVLACEAARRAGARLFVINGSDIMSEYYGGSEASITAVFLAAKVCGPSVVFLDEADALMPSREPEDGGPASSGATSVSSRIVAALLTLMDGLSSTDNSNHSIVVIAATNRMDAVDPALRRPGRFDREIAVGVPTQEVRHDVLESRLAHFNHALTPKQIEELAAQSHGFVAADLSALCREAAMNALRRNVVKKSQTLAVDIEDFKIAQTRVRPSAIREISVEVPNVRWQDVGGLEYVKQQLKEAVEWPIRHAESLARLGTRPPGGVLLYGLPGCSKTLMAKAIATETGMNFLSVKGSELLSTYVGESEKAIAYLFDKARQLSPCIIFFDELDGLAGTRGHDLDGGTGVGERVVTQLLAELDGFRDRGSITVVGATNQPYAIDPALLRPGRFDRLIHVPPPDLESRKSIFMVVLSSMSIDPDVDIDGLAAETKDYTGADIASVCREAGLIALEEDLTALAVCHRHLLEALVVVPSSVVSESLCDFQQFKQEAPSLFHAYLQGILNETNKECINRLHGTWISCWHTLIHLIEAISKFFNRTCCTSFQVLQYVSAACFPQGRVRIDTQFIPSCAIHIEF